MRPTPKKTKLTRRPHNPTSTHNNLHSASSSQMPPPPQPPAPPAQTPHIPDEILLNILPRLPIKTIITFRCVCKHWNTLLSSNPDLSSAFTLHHHNNHRHVYLLISHHHLTTPIPLPRPHHPPPPSTTIDFFPTTLEPTTSVKHIVGLVAEDEDRAVIADVPLPRVDAGVSSVYNKVDVVDVEVVGCVEGLVCMVYNRGTIVVVWNPATRDSYQLPPPLLPSFGFWKTSFGFARASSSSKQGCVRYKVVRVVLGQNEDPSVESSREVMAEMYDSESNSWSVIADVPVETISSPCCDVIVEGVPYWTTHSSEYFSSKTDTIISFNPTLDMFRKFEKPAFTDDSRYNWRLGKVNQSLAVIREFYSRSSVEVWMMIEDEFNGVCWVNELPMMRNCGVEKWLTCWRDCEFLVSGWTADCWHPKHATNTRDRKINSSKKYCKEMFLYNGRSKNFRLFPEFRPQQKSTFKVYMYVESMAVPNPLCGHQY